jgi:uncharacterized protein involved in type VI secretion and phage assembly
VRIAAVYPGARLAVDASLRGLTAREYRVQYNETDLDFVRRPLEHEGLPFYFRRDDDGSETRCWRGRSTPMPRCRRSTGPRCGWPTTAAATSPA